eukprot:gene13410-14744_t
MNHPIALIKSLLYYQLCNVINPEDPGVVAYYFQCLIKKDDLLGVLNSKSYNEEDLKKAMGLVCYGLKALHEGQLGEQLEGRSSANASSEERKPLLLIIDAVNEVDPSSKHLLHAFMSEIAGYLESMPNIKILVTSKDHAKDFGLADLCKYTSFNDEISEQGNKLAAIALISKWGLPTRA